MTSHRRIIFTALLTLIGSFAAGGVTVARAEGAAPNSTGAAESTFDLQAYVDEAVARGESIIVLPKGRHRVAPTRAVHLRLRGLSDVTLVAEGFELVCTETTRALEIEDCHGLTVSGLAIDYDPLPYTQGRIVELSADKRTHEIEILEGYPEAQTATTQKYQVFRESDRTLRWVDYYDPEIEALSATRLRVTKTRPDPLPRERVGDLIVIGSGSVGARTLPHAVVLTSSSGIRLDHVTVYASNCFAFLENDCDRTTYQRCRVAKRGPVDDPVQRAEPRLRSTNADAFHSKRATRGPQIVSCYAHYQGDDCVNINGDYHLVARSSDNRLRTIAKQSLDLRPGDVAELTELGGAVLPAAKVVAVKRLGSLNDSDHDLVASLKLHASLKSHQGGRLNTVYEVTLDRPVSLPLGSLIAAANRRGDGFTIAECDFGHVRSRGIIIKASHGEIRDNRLQGCRGESIKVASEPYWLESGAASNVRIVRNAIADCGSVAIAVYARGDARGFASNAAHKEITISDNRILRSPMPNVFVSSSHAVRLERNRSRVSQSMPPRDHALLRSLAAVNAEPSTILLHLCSDVVMESNLTQ